MQYRPAQTAPLRPWPRAAHRLLPLATLLLGGLATAAEPDSGLLSPATPTLSYTAGPFVASNPSSTADGAPVCGPQVCDSYLLTVSLPAGATATRVKISIGWDDVGSDYDLHVYRGDQTGVDGPQPTADAGESAGGNQPEVVSFDALPGTTQAYTIKVVPWLVTPGDPGFTGTITLSAGSGGGGGGGGGGDEETSCTLPAGVRP